MGNGVQKSTKGKGGSEGGRQTCPVHQHLEIVNRRHLGIEYNKGFCNTSQRGTPTGSNILRSGVLKEQAAPKRRDKILAAEGCHFPVQGEYRMVLLNHISGPQSVGGSTSLQNGGYYNPTGPVEAWRLDGESRSEGCILHHPNSPSPSAITEVLSRHSLLPVHLPPFQPLMCPMDIHQSDEAFDETTEDMGHQDNNLHRQHAYPGGTKEEATHHLEVLLYLLEALGFIVNREKSQLNPAQELKLLRLECGLAVSPTQVARQEDKANLQRGSPIASKRVLSAFPIPGQAQCSIPGNAGCSTVLPSPARGSPSSPITGSSGLRISTEVVQGIPGRIGLVAESPCSLKWEDSYSETGSDSDSVGRFPSRLGVCVCVQGSEH